MPEVSIIVPVYKVEPYLRRCVDSILAQTFTDFELILVDDGSPDNCPAICDEYAERDSRVRVIHKENGGVSSARNAGMEAAVGGYFLFCDSDDYVSPYWCEVLYKQIKRTPNALVYCDLVKIDEENELKPIMQEPAGERARETSYYEMYKMGLSWSTCNKIYIAEKIRNYALSFSEKYIIAEDVDFNTRYQKYCNVNIYIPEKLYAYVLRAESATHVYVPNKLSIHLMPFYVRVTFIDDKDLSSYCDDWLYYFIILLRNVFDERNKKPWVQKILYNQRAIESKEFQFCLSHASGKNENPLMLKILKTKCYLLYLLFEKAASLRHKK